MYESLLPVGSVVSLKGADRRVIVIGRLQVMEGRNEVFDYCACAYPEGMVDARSLVFFNDDDIDLLYFVGFQDPEELRFRSEVLAQLGELYIDENGQVVERERPSEEATADEAPASADPEPIADDDEGGVETPVFAEV